MYSIRMIISHHNQSHPPPDRSRQTWKYLGRSRWPRSRWWALNHYTRKRPCLLRRRWWVWACIGLCHPKNLARHKCRRCNHKTDPTDNLNQSCIPLDILGSSTHRSQSTQIGRRRMCKPATDDILRNSTRSHIRTRPLPATHHRLLQSHSPLAGIQSDLLHTSPPGIPVPTPHNPSSSPPLPRPYKIPDRTHLAAHSAPQSAPRTSTILADSDTHCPLYTTALRHHWPRQQSRPHLHV
jgi:hypothetical protein